MLFVVDYVNVVVLIVVVVVVVVVSCRCPLFSGCTYNTSGHDDALFVYVIVS